MSFTHKEPLQPKLTALPASNDIEALVRAEHPDPFSILGPHDDEQGGQFIRAFLPEALSVQVLARDGGEPLGNLDATQVPGLFVGHFTTLNSDSWMFSLWRPVTEAINLFTVNVNIVCHCFFPLLSIFSF